MKLFYCTMESGDGFPLAGAHFLARDAADARRIAEADFNKEVDPAALADPTEREVAARMLDHMRAAKAGGYVIKAKQSASKYPERMAVNAERRGLM